MKESFMLLPKEKQNEIINAGFDQFSCYSYRKCPVGRIAEQAHISKSLLFYYFKEIFREFSLTCMGDESDFFDIVNYYMY